ncbi:MAG: thioredoxin family protein [Rhodothermales bacterium]
MARTLSETAAPGTAAPDFALPIANPEVDDRGGPTRQLGDYAEAEALVVVFMCNHCPYVHAVEDRLTALAREVAPRVQVVGICSNDAERYPADSFEAMAERARAKAYPFPYLHDESQTAARAYGAVCTPDFFVYDADRRLAYRGRLDDGRPGQPATRPDLRRALDELLETGAVTAEQVPSMGCSIKWKDPA